MVEVSAQRWRESRLESWRRRRFGEAKHGSVYSRSDGDGYDGGSEVDRSTRFKNNTVLYCTVEDRIRTGTRVGIVMGRSSSSTSSLHYHYYGWRWGAEPTTRPLDLPEDEKIYTHITVLFWSSHALDDLEHTYSIASYLLYALPRHLACDHQPLAWEVNISMPHPVRPSFR
nr:hypothetical protein CFP56_43688 [Quercus suber]